MKRKSPRGIPDFSRKGPQKQHPDQPAQETKPAPAPAPRTQAKPQATSSKSGHRGK